MRHELQNLKQLITDDDEYIDLKERWKGFAKTACSHSGKKIPTEIGELTVPELKFDDGSASIRVSVTDVDLACLFRAYSTGGILQFGHYVTNEFGREEFMHTHSVILDKSGEALDSETHKGTNQLFDSRTFLDQVFFSTLTDALRSAWEDRKR